MSLFLQRNTFGEILHYIICSPKDPLQGMGAVRMKVQKHHNNLQVMQVIHKHVCYKQSMSVKYVCYKQIHH